MAVNFKRDLTIMNNSHFHPNPSRNKIRTFRLASGKGLEILRPHIHHQSSPKNKIVLRTMSPRSRPYTIREASPKRIHNDVPKHWFIRSSTPPKLSDQQRRRRNEEIAQTARVNSEVISEVDTSTDETEDTRVIVLDEKNIDDLVIDEEPGEIKVKTLKAGKSAEARKGGVRKERKNTRPEVERPVSSRRRYVRVAPEIQNDTKYKDKRERNNDSVKKSRYRRRQMWKGLELEYATLTERKEQLKLDLDVKIKEIELLRTMVNEQIDASGLEKGILERVSSRWKMTLEQGEQLITGKPFSIFAAQNDY